MRNKTVFEVYDKEEIWILDPLFHASYFETFTFLDFCLSVLKRVHNSLLVYILLFQIIFPKRLFH